MARNESSKTGMTDGLFGTRSPKKNLEVEQVEDVIQSEKEKPSTPPVNTAVNINKKTDTIKVAKKVGRPRDVDLQKNEETFPISVQLTDATLYKVDAYKLNNKEKSRSQIIRELINTHL